MANAVQVAAGSGGGISAAGGSLPLFNARTADLALDHTFTGYSDTLSAPSAAITGAGDDRGILRITVEGETVLVVVDPDPATATKNIRCPAGVHFTPYKPGDKVAVKLA